MTDEDIERAMRDDPDWADFVDIDWSKVEVRRPALKVPISIRIDPDVLEYFRQDGPGYQKRINAVLRAFVEEKRRAK